MLTTLGEVFSSACSQKSQQAPFFMNSFALMYRGEPFLMAEKPVIFKAARAFLTAIIQGLALPRALFFLLTTLPYLFLDRSFAVRPPTVLTFDPRSTKALLILPLAILLTFMAFIAFMAFMAFFIAFIDFIAFMAFIDFMAFIGAASAPFFFAAFIAFIAAFFIAAFIAFIGAASAPFFFAAFIAFIPAFIAAFFIAAFMAFIGGLGGESEACAQRNHLSLASMRRSHRTCSSTLQGPGAHCHFVVARV